MSPALERERRRRIRETIEASLAELPPMLSAEEAMRALGVSRRTLYDVIRSGELVAVKHGAHKGARVVVPRAAVVDFLARRAVR